MFDEKILNRIDEHVTISSAVFMVLVALVLIGAGLGGAVESRPVQDSSSTTPTPITSCTTITEPGTYVLTENITNSSEPRCLVISSNDVVLDGQGHTLDGTDHESINESTIGVLVSNTQSSLTNVTVHNLTVSEWSEDGIRFNNVSGGRVENIIAKDNIGSGINVTASNGFVITGVNASGSGSGIRILDTSDSVIRNIHTIDNTHGISSFGGKNTTIQGTVSTGNWIGIYLIFTPESVIADNIVYSSNVTGIEVSSSQNTLVRNNTVMDTGIVTDIESDDKTGVLIDHSTGTTLVGNTIVGNEPVGLLLVNNVTNTQIYNNKFVNQDNIELGDQYRATRISLNRSRTTAQNIVGRSITGGNYWGHPDGTGYSQTCTDADTDGICDQPYAIRHDGIVTTVLSLVTDTTIATDHAPLVGSSPRPDSETGSGLPTPFLILAVVVVCAAGVLIGITLKVRQGTV